jgi:hypothetical protein
MKALYFFILFLFSFNNIFSQGEIIDRKTKAGKEFSLKIQKVTADSIIYKHAGIQESIALTDVIAYRKDYIEDYIFPNPSDKEKYEIKDSYAVDKSFGYYELKVIDKQDLIIRLLKDYEVHKEDPDYSTLDHKIILSHTTTNKTEKGNPKKSFFIVLKKDQRLLELRVKLFKIVNDSILYVCAIVKKKDQRFYAIPVKDIKCIKLEPQRLFTTRMISGGVSCLLAPFVFIPIYLFSHPFTQTYDLERTWKLQLTEQSMVSKKERE